MRSLKHNRTVRHNADTYKPENSQLSNKQSAELVVVQSLKKQSQFILDSNLLHCDCQLQPLWY
jgi:hypothetical protein